MKRLGLALILGLILAVALAACGEDEEEATPVVQPTSAPVVQPTTPPAAVVQPTAAPVEVVTLWGGERVHRGRAGSRVNRN